MWGIVAALTLAGALVSNYFRLDGKLDNKFEKLDNRILDIINMDKNK